MPAPGRSRTRSPERCAASAQRGRKRAMVAVTQAVPATGNPETTAAWLAGLAGTYPDAELVTFAAAAQYAAERCAGIPGRDGEPLFERAAGTARILATLKLDAASVRAALLVGLPTAHAFDADDVTTRFGQDAAALV